MASSLEKRILEEIIQKIDAREARMSAIYETVAGTDDLFRIRRPKRKQNTFSNPRLTEFHRGSITLGTLLYRMMTAKDPFFSVIPMDVGDPMDHVEQYLAYERAETIQHAMGAQLRAAKYKQQLLKANMFCVPFGTVVCQEDYTVVGVNSRGRRVPVTNFVPRMLDQIIFDGGATDIESADWLATADIVSNGTLRRLLGEIEEIGAPYNKKAIEDAIKLEEKSNTINQYVLSRLRRANANQEDSFSENKEFLCYYGKIDALNDGLEYVCAIINRKIMIRFHANNYQHGKKGFRIAKWIDWAGPMGLGAGELLGPYHRSLDANRQKAQDIVTFDAYAMWKRKKNSGGGEMQIAPNKIHELDELNDLQPLESRARNVEGAFRLEDLMVREFRNAFGATDTLQAIVTDATASEVSLAQNEALRRVSVAAESISENLVREHLEVTHSNNGEYITEPFNINRSGIAQRVYPADFQFDADFELLLTTDKDYKPQRLEKMIQSLQIITSTKSTHPELSAAPVQTLVNEILYSLDVPVNKWKPGPMAPAPIDPGMLASLGSQSVPTQDMGGAQVAGMQVIRTPAGNVLGSAGI